MSHNQRLTSALILPLLGWLAAAQEHSAWLEDPIPQAPDQRVLRDIPQFVLDYAPLVHLHKEEPFWPCDVNEHLRYITPYVNGTQTDKQPVVDEVAHLNKLDGQGGKWLYLKSKDYIDLWRDENIKNLPGWLIGEYGIPAAPDGDRDDMPDDTKAGENEQTHEDPLKDLNLWYKVGPSTSPLVASSPSSQSERWLHQLSNSSSPGGRSAAPAVLIVVEKAEGVIDAFWFYFYSYNLGNSVFRFRFGNHVGDWEHSVVRFYNGVPKAVYLSQHEWAKAYTYEAVEKIGKRPVIYAASGTHALYATPGSQPYGLPLRLLHDSTSKGPLWDPVLNIYSYHYNTTLAHGDDLSINSIPSVSALSGTDFSTLTYPYSLIPDPQANTLTASSLTPNAPTSWFYFAGHWGDQAYPSSDSRQYHIFSEKAYVSGPLGPRFKALGRLTVCPYANDCEIRESIETRWVLRLIVDWLAAAGIVWIAIGVGLSIRSCLRAAGRQCFGTSAAEKERAERRDRKGKGKAKWTDDVVDVEGAVRHSDTETDRDREREPLLRSDMDEVSSFWARG